MLDLRCICAHSYRLADDSERKVSRERGNLTLHDGYFKVSISTPTMVVDVIWRPSESGAPRGVEHSESLGMEVENLRWAGAGPPSCSIRDTFESNRVCDLR